MPIIDLHCHSTVSDGLLSPVELVERAAQNGVEILALTDHDDGDGNAEARCVASALGMTFVDGVEISATWRGRTIHIVGLGIDPDHSSIKEGLRGIREGRESRAELMAADLCKAGIGGSLEGAYSYAKNSRLIGRTHFARFLVDKGYAKDIPGVFKKFLVRGKPGYVSHLWADLNDAVSWIAESGGLAVIAHPGRYGLSSTAMKALLSQFKEMGGSGIEVVTSNHSAEQAMHFSQYAKNFELLASLGSDFHGPGESRVELGRLPPLPAGCMPIWERLQ